MPYIYWDSTYILVVIGAVICMIASARVKTTFNKYSAYRSMSGMTGAQAAERISSQRKSISGISIYRR